MTEGISKTYAAIPDCVHGGKWWALYADRNGKLTVAGDARGKIIICDTKALARSVARHRRRRLKCFSRACR